MSIVGAFMVPHPPLIVSEVGRGEEKKVIKTINSYNEVGKEIEKLKPDTIVITSPHAPFYSNAFHIIGNSKITGSFHNFGASNVSFAEKIDIELVDEIERISKKIGFPLVKEEVDELDHGSMVPLYFVRKYYKSAKIVIAGLSNLSLFTNYQFGTIIKDAINNLDKKVVFIASGDLSHKLQEYGPYGFIKEGPIYDKRIMETMGNGSFKELIEYDLDFLEKAAECGHRSFTIMAGAFDGVSVDSKYLSHEDITGVGYGIVSYYPNNKKKDKLNSTDKYVRLAKDTIYEYLNNNRIIDIPEYVDSDMLNNKAGVFVSLHKFDALRGCIGTFMPTKENIAKEIISNAISAAINDYRFKKVSKEEVDYLEINVDVLSEPEIINSKDKLDPKKYGVIVTSGYKRGLLLPDLEGIDDIDEQIKIAKEKAGIKENEECELQRFTVDRHK